MVTGRVAELEPVPKAVVNAFVMLAMNLSNQSKLRLSYLLTNPINLVGINKLHFEEDN